MTREHGFAARLREWRQRRGWSQLDLAARADISQRHLSFLELARAAPSRDMVLRLATALDIPLRQHNALLLAAGFAPVWQETDLGAPELADVHHALDYILAQQEPFPAVAVDRHWNLLQSNSGAVRLVEFLVGPLAPDAAINLADALVAPDVLVHLKAIRGNDGVAYTNHGALIGSFITLDELSRLPLIRGRYPVLAEAAESVGTPQIRNAGTLAGNVCQRPWCWYYRNGFPCFNNGGNKCFSVGDENQFHASFGGGPSFILARVTAASCSALISA